MSTQRANRDKPRGPSLPRCPNISITPASGVKSHNFAQALNDALAPALCVPPGATVAKAGVPRDRGSAPREGRDARAERDRQTAHTARHGVRDIVSKGRATHITNNPHIS